jgi:hypothetical protein
MEETSRATNTRFLESDMEKVMGDLDANITRVKNSLSDAIASVEQEVSERNSSYHQFAQDEYAFHGRVQALQEEVAHAELSGMQTFIREFKDTGAQMNSSATAFREENDAVFHRMRQLLGFLNASRGRAESTVRASVSKLQDNLAHSDRELARLLELEKYQGIERLNNVSDGIDDVDHSIDTLKSWRDAAEHNQSIWQQRVQHKFNEMGEALDLTELSAEEEQVSQNFAVQQAISHLNVHLGDELNSLSHFGQFQIAALTAAAGDEIKALLADNTLTDEEKAKRLAEIKDKLNRDALRVIRGSAIGDRHTAALERRLRSAKEDINSAVAQIHTYAQHRGPAGETVSQDFTRLLQQVHDAHEDALARSSTPSSAFLERAGNSRAGAIEAERTLADRDAHLEHLLEAMVTG